MNESKKFFLLNILMFFLGCFISVIIFLIYDYYSSQNKMSLQDFDEGWYELKKNFVGTEKWGTKTFKIATDQNGFRVNPIQDKNGKADFIFLGDSFTFGIGENWAKSFVGKFDASTNKKIVNAGTTSYSPTAYLYQYQKALKSNILKDNHNVIVCLDISDVQDEAGYWMDGYQNPIKRIYIKNDLKKYFRENFKFSHLIVTYVRNLFIDPHNPFLQERMSIRSAFTFEDWSKLDDKTPLDGIGGYAPLGVEGGLNKIYKKLKEISDITKSSKSKMYILIYPWPNQLIYPQKFNWSDYITNLCAKITCDGVIDAQPNFLRFKDDNIDWKDELFIEGDVHYSTKGNLMIYEVLKSFFKE